LRLIWMADVEESVAFAFPVRTVKAGHPEAEAVPSVVR
jgi:hypothetical protein